MLSEILRLSDRELGQLLIALSRGTIRPGGGASQVRRAGLVEHETLIDSWLIESIESFGSTRALATALELVLSERTRHERVGLQEELVLTGPSVGGDPYRDTGVVVREVFQSARRSVLIVGYAFYGSDRIFEPLARRMAADPRLTTRLVVNIQPSPGRPPGEVVAGFAAGFLGASWPFHPRPEIYYLPGSLDPRGARRASVHAKLIVVDEATIYLGSANFTTAAFRRNIEAGFRLNSPPLGWQLTQHFTRMIDDGILKPLPLG